MITLLQPSREMILMFDKVLILAETPDTEGSSSQIYFGPPDEMSLLQHFGPPAEGIDIYDHVLRVCSGSIASTWIRNYRTSQRYAWLQEELRVINEQVIAKEYSISEHASMGTQLKAIALRRFYLIVRNRMTYARVFIGVIFAVIVGSLFQDPEENMVGMPRPSRVLVPLVVPNTHVECCRDAAGQFSAARHFSQAHGLSILPHIAHTTLRCSSWISP